MLLMRLSAHSVTAARRTIRAAPVRDMLVLAQTAAFCESEQRRTRRSQRSERRDLAKLRQVWRNFANQEHAAESS
jgi:hypothetical protein